MKSTKEFVEYTKTQLVAKQLLIAIAALSLLIGCSDSEPVANKEEQSPPRQTASTEPAEKQAESAATKPAVKAKREPIYDDGVKADKQIADAIVKAGQNNKHVLLVYGGNWCGWCFKLHDCFEDNENIKKLLASEYELVMVDASANQDVMKRFDATADGYPYLTVLDTDGKVLINQSTVPLEEGRSHVPDRVFAFLDKWKPEPLNADQVYRDALSLAEKENKSVLLRFGAPWCGWCHRFDDFLAIPEIATIMAENYILIKIDLQRTSEAQAFHARIRPQNGGIPWFAIFDAKGKSLTTSTGPQGNIGYPVKPEEIAYFITMIKKTAKNITPEQIQAIEKKLSSS